MRRQTQSQTVSTKRTNERERERTQKTQSMTATTTILQNYYPKVKLWFELTQTSSRSIFETLRHFNRLMSINQTPLFFIVPFSIDSHWILNITKHVQSLMCV